ncbi:3-isopropylmalate dehydratase large subunit [Haliangium ochraceum]|uniref:3-isopropylmalate dehydratase n=1 Tax=Haliangium ochraceum (strain DSM 14365 / JCM 11303 / SMP-2) TaxID=502025 RepID=D0LNR9_HALO1|nr:aconitase/3-isopropylmalate dehydratase large subunit family protein [Haliangium ochraceum]ACY16974.1 3-isopropylmalate dehydratase [Haliangium ochraceum DSM 14365]
MSGTISDKVIAAHAVSVSAAAADDQFTRVRVDAVLGHDATISLLMDEFLARGLTIWDPRKVLFTNDHFSPPANIERANISRSFLAFSRAQEVGHLAVDQGICHQLLVENPLCQPGSLIVGADSHTIMAGALGACATGMGSTDILFALATGTTWMRRPESIRIELRGALPAACSGRDIILELLRLLGEGGAQYRSVEFHDRCTTPLTQDTRFAIANMAVEAGAKFGVFQPDDVTVAYCAKRDGRPPERLVYADADARYERVIEFDVSQLTPRVARPWSPANVVALSELPDTPITFAFLGSCSSGRIEDLREAADELRGRQVHPSVRFVVIPGSRDVLRQALREGLVTELTDAGALFNQPSCGPCGGIDKGVLARSDVCVSTSNRNFRGRMGHWDSRTYLASARTVARAALRGKLSGDLYA